MWDTQENDTMREHYLTMSVSQLLPMLPGRSESSIRQHAIKIGLKRQDIWTPQEDALLKSIYTQGTKKDILGQISKPWRHIYHRASELLGLKRNKDVVEQEMREAGKKSIQSPKVHAWSPSEIVSLKTIYPTMSKKDAKKVFPNRTWKEMRQKAVSIGIRRRKQFIDKDRTELNKETLRTRYGVDCPLRIPSVRKKMIEEMKKTGIGVSKEELKFLHYLREIDVYTKHNIIHQPTTYVIDFYMPSEDLWVQYDGIYWHGKMKPRIGTKQQSVIAETMRRDEDQLKSIPNLIRFWSDEIKGKNVPEYIRKRIVAFRENGIKRIQ